MNDGTETVRTPVAGEVPLNGEAGEISRAGFWALALGSVGVVYGDIGTSPLYAFRQAIIAASGPDHYDAIRQGHEQIARGSVLGVLSLISLGADDHGHLQVCARSPARRQQWRRRHADPDGAGVAGVARGEPAVAVIALLGIISAALFYGDSVITPALSVLSAIEGIDVATPALQDYVVPLTVVILIALFAFQSRGTARVAALFGPVMTIWFGAIAVAGASWILADPSVLWALDPIYGALFLVHHGAISLYTLGAVFLAVTGAEALFADLGHFGRGPIQFAWLVLVLPALALNYLGQGGQMMAHPQAIENPFFLLYPGWARIPMVMLATAATVIASQAVISGAYSMTSQAIQLGLLPRLEIRHTSAQQAGQIFMPRVNALLLLGVLLLVLMFRSSSALGSAYGIAVSGTMVVTGLMAFIVIWRTWGYSLVAAGVLMAPFVFIDLSFLSANMLKVIEGGWVPLALGGTLMLVMYTWRRGTRLLSEKTRRQEIPLDDLVRTLEKGPPKRVPGTAVFLTSNPKNAPTALLHSLKHYKVLHEHNVILSVQTAHTPRVESKDRVRLEPIGASFMRVHLRFGYMERPNVPRALAIARRLGWQFEILSTSFFLSRRTLRPAPHSGMPRWQDRLFITLARSANDATDYFQIPTNRVVEVGTQVNI